MKALDKLKTLLAIDLSDTTKDYLLTLLLEQADDDFRNITGQEQSIENLVVRMAIILYNLQGAEGLAATSISGVSETYSHYNEIMPSILRYRRLKVL